MVATGSVGSGLTGVQVEVGGGGDGENVASVAGAGVGSESEGVAGAVTLFLATVTTVHPNARVESSHIRLTGFGVSITNCLILVRLDVMSGSC
jgi:hypothetical protein